MKKFPCMIFIIIIIMNFASCVTTGSDQSPKNALNWAGTYKGTIPAASSPGIRVEMTLNTDSTYKVIYEYIDRGNDAVVYIGYFAWNRAGNMITLNSKEIPVFYTVEENRLIQLDMNRKKITGELADLYILKKQ